MQYIIMFLIVVGLALADFLTGYIKARCQDNVQSKQMRIGGLHKFAELVVMGTAIGLDIGMRYLGKYFQSQQLADITGAITAIGVFGYITVMEIISILENYADINPKAAGWIGRLLKNLKGRE
jgi:phage-related holin